MTDQQPRSLASSPLVEGYALGPFATNCYVVHVPPHPECWIIDASFQPARMIQRIREAELTPAVLILTHAHVDHIAGLDQVRAAFPGIQVWLHEAEADWLGDPSKNLSLGFGEPYATSPADRLLSGEEELELSGTKWQLHHTPGHSPGSITLHHADSSTAIVGDTLFAGSIGRFDFPTSDQGALFRSIREVLYSMPEETRVLPGHGPETTIGREKKSNPFVRPE